MLFWTCLVTGSSCVLGDSDVRLLGTPNLETHPRMRALAQDTAVISASGTASGHLDHLSVALSVYRGCVNTQPKVPISFSLFLVSS